MELMSEINRLRTEIEALRVRYGHEAFEAALRNSDDPHPSLMIVGNCGLHPVPEILPEAQRYCATEGNLDFSTGDAVDREIREMISRLSEKLRSKKWGRIYLLPFGHPVFSMHIKMTVYRVLGVETAEVFHRGGGQYSVIYIDDRAAMLSAR